VPLPPQRPPPDDPMRFRPMEEEATRSELAASDPPKNPMMSTLESGAPLNTTLMEGRTPQSVLDAIRSVPPPNSMQSAPPESLERPVSVQQVPSFQPPPVVQPAPPPPSRGRLFAITGVLAMGVLVLLFLLLRHH